MILYAFLGNHALLVQNISSLLEAAFKSPNPIGY